MKHTKFWARFFLVASIITAALIFWFSAQDGIDSQAMSDPVTLHVARIVRPNFMKMPESDRISYLEWLSLIIRKNAHFCEYMLLGFNLMGAMRFYLPGRKSGACRLRAMAVAVPYAASDELHQLFVSERSARALDVLIDSAGSLTGTLVMALGLMILAKMYQLRKSRS